MKKIIRRNTFETNSSSSHSISIVKNEQELQFPKKIRFKIHSFNHYPEDGDYMDEMSGRANYLYSIAVYLDEHEEFQERITKLLGDKVKLYFDPTPNWWEDEFDDLRWTLINHQAQDEARELFEKIMEDDVLLLNYLFDDKTDIEICGDWAIKGVKDDDDRLVFGYGKKKVEEWDNERW